MRLSILTLFLNISVALGAPLNVAVDAGHGGTDTGAKRGLVKESEVVLRVAHELHKLLSQDSRFVSVMTRTTDQNMALDARTLFAEKNKADIFVSIHANSAPDGRIHGTEIYFQNQLPPDQETLFLANRENDGSARSKDKAIGDVNSIIGDLEKHHQTMLSFQLAKDVHQVWPKRKKSRVNVRQAPFHVLTEISLPSILIETGYLTNSEEAQWLNQISTQKQIAQTIYKSLILFKDTWDKIPKSN